MIYVILTAVVSIGILLGVVAFSASMYHRACKLNPYNLKKSRLEAAITAGTSQLYMLRNEIKHLQEQELEVKRIIDKKEAMEKFINDFQEEYDNKTKLFNDINNDIEGAKDKLEAANKNIEEKNNEITELERQIDKGNKDLNEAERKYQEICEKINESNDSIEALKDEIETLKVTRDDLNSEIRNLENEKKQLERENDAARQRKSEIGDAIKAAQDKLVELTSEINKLTVEIGGKIGMREGSQTRWEDLDRPYFNVISETPETDDENRMLEDFSETLKDSKIIFDDRIINAFHTGLKAEDASPLVVLAGISGTGKSLLPSLYAQAFGMNFLSVAVQPRWDSPQDMFGFYNYMQNRYKATELSRMLWQYDIYNNESAANNFSEDGDLPMNIILLDEMNLARVEYYFSDMLSKLEIRRNITDRSSAEERMPAEIEIEGGAIGDTTSARRLFVNSNVLFVGTMNEDETTQSLSDKVMDRANVLRFGKPASINANMNISVFNEKYPKAEFNMQLKQWNRWCHSQNLNPSFRNTLDEIVSHLNDEMANIGRPFAYRVWRSIETYVSLYPGVAAGDRGKFNAALSDQIEMKILPKLNGVDLSVPKVKTALTSMNGIIEGVKDQKLSSAFENIISNTDNVFFQWKGVER